MIPVFRLFATLVLAAVPVTGGAATFEILDTRRYTDAEMRDQFLCNIEISGPIEAGDAERLQGIFDAQFQNPPPDPTGWIACLDSAGGQFEAGIALGEILARYGWATRVRQDAECLSACAVAFLFGTFVAYDSALNLRIMDRGARIGFHAPRLQYDGEDVPGAVVGQAYDAALIGLGNLMNAAMNAPRLAPDEVLPRRLLSGMLAAGADEFYEIETIRQLVAYDIVLSLLNWQMPESVTSVDIWPGHVCVNAHLAQGLDVDPLQPIGLLNTRHWGIPDPPQGWLDYHIDDFWTNACHIRYDEEGKFFEVETFRSGTETGSAWMQLYAVVAPETTIASLPR